METPGPHNLAIPVRCCTQKAPRPTCGKLGRRKDIHHRQVRTIASKELTYLVITYGEYRARCDCCTTFRTTLPGIGPKVHYDNRVQQAVLSPGASKPAL